MGGLVGFNDDTALAVTSETRTPAGRHAARVSWPGRSAVPMALCLVLAAMSFRLVSPKAEATADLNLGWIYLRDGTPPGTEDELVEILAVGDVMTGRSMAEVDDIFRHVAPELQSADLAVGNLEGAVGLHPAAEAGIPLLLSADAPSALAEAGFDLLSLANNHSLDAGPSGLEATRREVRQAGIEPIESERITTVRVDGMTFALFAWNDLGGEPQGDMLAEVRRAKASADHVVVLVHWGREYERRPALPQRELADALLEAGADVVLGSHPHVVQDLRVLPPAMPGEGAGLVAYSLGNFVFDQGWGDTGQGLALRLLFDEDGLCAAQALPLWTSPRPRWMNLQDSAVLLDRILPPARQAFACSDDRCWSVPASADSRSGSFFAGAIDLTGDGTNEIIRREDGQVRILEAGKVVWRSPPDWNVVDLALGDPNDDGRFEAMLAIEKGSAGGEVASQPFVIGYRGGRYLDLWGGSPVHAPLVEVELADVDGDGAEELVVLEAPPQESGLCVTVWRWHGWGFNLVWRTAPGNYHDLLAAPAEGEMAATISVAVDR
jgi:hypothetical protein